MSKQGAPPGLIVHLIPNTATTHEDESMLDAGTRPGSAIQSPRDAADEHEDETMSDPDPPHPDAGVHGYQTLKPVSQAAPTDIELGPHRPSVSSERKDSRQTLTHLHHPKEDIDEFYLSDDKKFWFCCACNDGPKLTAINEGCSHCCNHWRCNRCRVYLEDLH